MGMREVIFPWKIGKKGILLTFLANNIYRGVLTEKLYANNMKHRVFERMYVFSTKYGHESIVIIREWTFFTKYGHESSDFLWRIGKKWDPIDFFGQ